MYSNRCLNFYRILQKLGGAHRMRELLYNEHLAFYENPLKAGFLMPSISRHRFTGDNKGVRNVK